MSPTINVNLSGVGFVFNCDAYSLLYEYLESLKKVFERSGDEGEDISADIEARCAELIIEKHDPGEYIVTAKDITEIISILGQPDEILEYTECESVEDTETGDKKVVEEEVRSIPEPPRLKKRLYRTPDDKILGGVCGGLAAYLGIDPTIVRLAVVALSLLTATTCVIVYIVLWIIVPPAVTPLQQMQLRGEIPSLKNIGNQFTSWFSNKEKNHTDTSRDNYAQFAMNYQQYDSSRYPQNTSVMASVWNVIAIIFGFLALPVAVVVLIVEIPIGVSTLVAMFSGSAIIFRDSFPPEILNSGLQPALILFTAFLFGIVVIMPLIALIYTCFRRLSQAAPMKHKNVTVYWISWLLCLVVDITLFGIILYAANY